MSSDLAAPILKKIGREQEDIIGGFSALPDGQVFNKPIQVTLPVELEPEDFIISHEVNIEEESYTLTEGAFICNPTEGTVTFSVVNLS